MLLLLLSFVYFCYSMPLLPSLVFVMKNNVTIKHFDFEEASLPVSATTSPRTGGLCRE